MDKLNIPVLDLRPEIESLWDELQAAIAGVLRSGQFIMGPNVKAFEDEVAQYLGVKHAVGLNSGTDALFIALRALGIGVGDEVITTAFTFFATAEAISHVGATPVFVDIDPATFNIDPAKIPAVVTPRAKAIIPVHLFGHPCDMEPILTVAHEHGLKVVEDVAQAFGAEYKGRRTGTIGEIGCLSFFPTKNLGAYGDGGMLVTDDDQIAETARMLRAHGSKKKYHNEMVGYNSRLDEIQAAILRVKLPHVDVWNEQRREVALRYHGLLSEITGITVPAEQPYAKHVYHQYTVRLPCSQRDGVQQWAASAGVQTAVYYPVEVHRMGVYADTADVLPNAECARDCVLSLPMWPQMALQAQVHIKGVLSDALRAVPFARRPALSEPS